MAKEGFTTKHNDEDSFESAEFGAPITSIADKVQTSNPNVYIKPGNRNFSAFLIQHGDKDDQVPYLESRELYEKIKAGGYSEKAVFEFINGAQHADKKFETKENVGRVLDFIDKYLK